MEELLIFFLLFSLFIFSRPAARGGQPCPAGEMQWRGVAVLAALQAQLPATGKGALRACQDCSGGSWEGRERRFCGAFPTISAAGGCLCGHLGPARPAVRDPLGGTGPG